MRKLFSLPLYPFLFIVHFFCHFYSTNIQEHPDLLHFTLLFGGSLLGAGILFGLLGMIFKNLNSAALFLMALGFTFFSYGHLRNLAGAHLLYPELVVPLAYALLLIAAGAAAFRFKSRLGEGNPYWNTVMLALMIMPLFSIVSYQIKNRNSLKDFPRQEAVKVDPVAGKKPDVYYLVLDEYPRQDVLEKVFHYDNSDFIDFLKARGFYVASQSHANYLKTRVSLPATLNMQYLDFLPQAMGDSKDYKLVTAMVFNNNVAQTFKKMGYRYILVDSGEAPSNYSPLADTTVTYSPFAAKELHVLMANTTVAKPVMQKFLNEQFRKRHLYNFAALTKIPELESPKFVMAHLIIPHPPFVFDREGNMPAQGNVEFDPQAESALGSEGKKLFLDQLIYLNRILKDVLTAILEKSKDRPVIILQSDTGPTPDGGWEPTSKFLSERAPTFSAFYLPPDAQSKLYPSISSVNTFRFVFDHVFGARFGLLEDKVYFADADKAPFLFQDVTRQALGDTTPQQSSQEKNPV